MKSSSKLFTRNHLSEMCERIKSFVDCSHYQVLGMSRWNSIQNVIHNKYNFHLEIVEITPFDEQHVDTWKLECTEWIAVRKLSIDSYEYEYSVLRVPSLSGNVLAMIISYVTTAGQRLHSANSAQNNNNNNKFQYEENSVRARPVCGTFILSARNER